MRTGAPLATERAAFLLAATAVFAYIVARAWTVPIVHDEAMNFFSFVEPDDFLPFRATYDAGNHLLVSALGTLCYKLFGLHAWALRIPSVLAFLLYAAYTWKWGRLVRGSLVRWCLWAALLATPFVIDFFSLFRGYAVAMAMLLVAAYALQALHREVTDRRLLVALLALAFGAYASLNLLVVWMAALALLAWRLLRVAATRAERIRWLGWWVVFGVLPFLVLAYYGIQLGRGGALYYGLDNGLVAGTVPSLLTRIMQ